MLPCFPYARTGQNVMEMIEESFYPCFCVTFCVGFSVGKRIGKCSQGFCCIQTVFRHSVGHFDSGFGTVASCEYEVEFTFHSREVFSFCFQIFKEGAVGAKLYFCIAWPCTHVYQALYVSSCRTTAMVSNTVNPYQSVNVVFFAEGGQVVCIIISYYGVVPVGFPEDKHTCS